MISIIIPTHYRERLWLQSQLYQRIKETAPWVEVIAVSDNPEIYERIRGDKVVKLPNWIGWTKQMNIGEKFASNDIVGHMDDSCQIVNKGWAEMALEDLRREFPDGMGVVEISGVKDCWSRGISTRNYLYSLNLGNMFWPEYIHGGDEEIYHRSKDKFYCRPGLLQETKYTDKSGTVVNKLKEYDEDLFNRRKEQDFPLKFQPEWTVRTRRYGFKVSQD